VGVTHPAADGKIFPSVAAFREWGRQNGHFNPDNGLVALAVHSASINKSEMELFRHLTDEFERQGVNVVIVYGDEPRVIHELLLDKTGKPAVDALLALSFKFKSGLGEPLRLALKQLDMPVFNALRLYRQTTPEWQASTRGMNDFSVAFGFIAPEISGMIEPSLLFGTNSTADPATGKTVQTSEPFIENIRITAQRLKKWIGLRQKANADKHIAIFIYNGSGGKQNIGASYLNVPRSLCNIVRALAREQYATGGLEALDEDAMTRQLLKHARNIGSWAPGELDAFLAQADAVRLPRAKYLEWFARLPEKLRRSVTAEWGSPEKCAIMTSGNDFILPETTENSEPSWFGFMLTRRDNTPFSRNELAQHLEANRIQTRNLFAGNLTRHPCFESLVEGCDYRIAGTLTNTDKIMNDSLWIGVYPGMSEAKLDYMVKTIKKFIK
ncbi:MAG: cobaltochelatase subunit CobN, partial [Victivallaceae bacterium]|nr:cobaltochelatase subunit CobN [Victivallaceae bacterium]